MQKSKIKIQDEKMIIKNNKEFKGVASAYLSSDRNPCTYSAQTILRDIIDKDMSDEQKALAIYKFCVSHFCHVEHMPKPDIPFEKNIGIVHDAIKLFNCYGFGLCWINCLVIGALYKKTGLPARIRTLDVPVKVALSGSGHVITEVFYNNSWHVLDNDLIDIVRGKDGHILSAEERKKEPLYAKILLPFYGKYTAIHPMDIILYRGLSFNRYFEPQGAPKLRYINCSHGSGPDTCLPYKKIGEKNIGKFGNAEIIYKPSLKDDSYIDGVYYSKNITPSPQGLIKKTDASGQVTFSVYSSYVIAGEYGKNKGAVIITGENIKGQISIEVSSNGGVSWKKLWQGKGKFRLDATLYAEGKYTYLVRIKFLKKCSILKNLTFKTYAMLVPASLPYLLPGVNKIKYQADNNFLLSFTPDISSGKNFLKNKPFKIKNIYWSKGPWKNLRLRLKNNKKSAELIYKIKCPHQITKILSNVLFTHESSPGTINFAVYISYDKGKKWHKISAYKPPKDENTWMSWIDIDHELKKSIKTDSFLIRFNIFDPKGDSNAGIADLNIYAYYRTFSDYKCNVLISHAWKEKRKLKIHKEEIAGPSKNYSIKCGKKIKNKYIKMKCK
jgi:hypothetical protein